jgi:hypothetical protein
MVSPLTGKAIAAEVPRGGARKPAEAADLGKRLARVELSASHKTEREGRAQKE